MFEPGLLRAEDFIRSSSDCSGNGLALLPGNDEWRGQQKVVATLAVNTPLRWIREHTMFHRRLVHTPRNVLLAWKRLSRRPVFHKFNSREQPKTAHVANMGM